MDAMMKELHEQVSGSFDYEPVDSIKNRMPNSSNEDVLEEFARINSVDFDTIAAKFEDQALLDHMAEARASYKEFESHLDDVPDYHATKRKFTQVLRELVIIVKNYDDIFAIHDEPACDAYKFVNKYKSDPELKKVVSSCSSLVSMHNNIKTTKNTICKLRLLIEQFGDGLIKNVDALNKKNDHLLNYIKLLEEKLTKQKTDE